MEDRALQEFANDLIDLTDDDLVQRYNDDMATDAWKEASTGYTDVMYREFASRDLDIAAITDGDSLVYNGPVTIDDGIVKLLRDV
ncbi:hypothetical protein [Lewinella sp. IMCC34183]|uniref:hypothetical protein n=1 Tax=Lewinella sp. IMCC34183 TaxID=2248762 RepID=UPI000E224E87|nr:hypothetical protein [Lewinella sp. IMCC34183]